MRARALLNRIIRVNLLVFQACVRYRHTSTYQITGVYPSSGLIEQVYVNSPNLATRARKEKLVELARDVYTRARSDVSSYESKFVCKHEITRLGAKALVEEHW
jgi:hypothetical protein